ncbi:MAG: hypothetical protein F4X14_05610 [Caldilineaceae bacterium SB0661_bin_32]|uniref:Ferritin-like domain-containing protein n=1 Tax=Caldilineaceae bacterium SB0661_bin_32 TaxID=2605255 RepID=A0A6B1D3J6_9CHLR|nr:hypothetical protein [Caldilineaceae bacterium SB0661_bin_32]
MNATAPPLAGLCTYAQGGEPGYSVERTVQLLRRYLFVESQTMRCLVAHLNAVPEWEVKCGLSLHLWQDAEHCTWLRNRVKEMRTPPLHLDRIPDSGLDAFFQELIRSRNTLELLTGVYRVLKPASIAAMQRHQSEANPLVDQPTRRLLRFILLEEEEQLAWGDATLRSLFDKVDSGDSVEPGECWAAHLQAYLDAAGGIAADGDRATEKELPPARAQEPFNPIRTPQRDERFTRVWHSRGRLPNGDISATERNWFQLYMRLTEMHVPELMALIIYDWDDQPWEFYHDMARQLWDEARHAMMGEIAFELSGLDWAAVPHEISFGEFPNSELEPADRHCLLWGIEQGLMKPDGKQLEYKVARESGDPLSTTFQDFDWADEVLHAQIGRRWLLPAFESMEAMQQRYEEVLARFQAILDQDQALARAEWWDAFYQQIPRQGKKQAPAPN